MRSRWRSVLARMRPPLRPSGQAADRLALLLLAVVAFKFSDWLWLSSGVSGRPALLANLLIQCLAFAVFCVLLARACRRPLPSWFSRIRLHQLLWYSPVLLLPVVLAVGIGVWSRTWRVSAAVLVWPPCGSVGGAWTSTWPRLPLRALAALLVMAQGPLRRAGNGRTLGVSLTGEFSNPPLEQHRPSS